MNVRGVSADGAAFWLAQVPALLAIAALYYLVHLVPFDPYWRGYTVGSLGAYVFVTAYAWLRRYLRRRVLG